MLSSEFYGAELYHAGRNRNGDSDNTGGGGGRLLRCLSPARTDLLERSDQAAEQQTPLCSLSSAPALSAPRPASSTVDWASILQVSLPTVIADRLTCQFLPHLGLNQGAGPSVGHHP